MLRKNARLAPINSAKTVSRRDIVSHSNLIAFSAQDAYGKAEEAAANQEGSAVATAHKLRLLTSCARRAAKNVDSLSV